ncbi:MAG: glutathione S-transferase family protein, partial [Pseudomonadota bacterium]
MRKLLALLLLPLALLSIPYVAGLVFYRSRRYRRASGWQSYRVPAASPLELHYTPMSLCSSKVLMSLVESGLDFRRVEVDIGHFGRFEQLTDSFLAMNPNACVPVLVHEGHPVLESHDILAYLSSTLEVAELAPPPGDTRAQQLMQRWVDRGSFGDMNGDMRGQLGGAVAILSYPLFAIDGAYMGLGTLLRALPHHPQPKIVLVKILNWFLGTTPPPAAMVRGAFDALEDGLAELAKALDDNGPWLAGERFTHADITWAANFARLDLLGVLPHFLESYPPLGKYWAALQARPSFNEVFQKPLEDSAEMKRLAEVARQAHARCDADGVR